MWQVWWVMVGVLIKKYIHMDAKGGVGDHQLTKIYVLDTCMYLYWRLVTRNSFIEMFPGNIKLFQRNAIVGAYH